MHFEQVDNVLRGRKFFSARFQADTAPHFDILINIREKKN
jgi:hypothetical protein